MEINSTHFVFDGDKIIIFPDLREVILFVQEIEKEIVGLLVFDTKLESIKKQYLEMMELVQALLGKLKENSIDFKITFSEHPSTLAERFKMNQTVRSQMIALFAYLETLLRLNIAYENKISDGDLIRELKLDAKNWESFYDSFCLNENNQWCHKNKERLKHITAHDLRFLRNSLTHFFSVEDGVQIADASLGKKARKLEQASNFQAKFLSPEDLFEIIRGAGILMIIKWSNDCQECLKTGSNEFKERILSANTLVKNSGAVLVSNEQINI